MTNPSHRCPPCMVESRCTLGRCRSSQSYRACGGKRRLWFPGIGTEAPADPLTGCPRGAVRWLIPIAYPAPTPPCSRHNGVFPKLLTAKKQKKAWIKKVLTPVVALRTGGEAPPLCSSEAPGRVSRAPPWAARRGAKDACTTVLSLYLERPALPLQKGVMLAKFFGPSGGMYPRNCQHCPYKRG